MRIATVVLTSAFFVAAPVGCKFFRKSSGDPAKPVSETVAQVGTKTITLADVRAKLQGQPSFAYARYKTIERKKEFVDGMVRTELLLQEAERRGLQNDPEVREAIEKVLVHKLTRVYSDEADKLHPVADTELRRYYDEHRSEFVMPTRVRISHLFLAVPEKDPRRARTTAEATKLVQQIRAKETAGIKQVFELTASQRSEDASTKATGGDLGFKTREELSQVGGAALADAALALKTTGEVGPVVPTPQGIHLIKLLGRHDGYETTFEAARDRIASRLQVERHSHAIDDLAADLKKKANVRINENVLSQLDVGLLSKAQ